MKQGSTVNLNRNWLFHLGDEPGAIRHAKAALAFGEERDRLDKRYNSGKWEHWYDRDIIYPCRSVTEKLRKAIDEQEKRRK